MAMMKIGELLTSKGYLDDEQLRVAISQQSVTGKFLGETLIQLGFVSSKEVAKALSDQAGYKFIDLHLYAISPEALNLIPRETAQKNKFIPLDLQDGVVSIGLLEATNIHAIDLVRKISGKQPKIFIVDSDGYYEALEKAYYFLDHHIMERIKAISAEIKNSEQVPVTAASELADLLITDGIRRNATDLHITPSSEAIHVSFRVDGVLQHTTCLHKDVHSGIVSRIKILSKLDIAEQRLPQDGSFTFEFLNQNYDMRVSVIPTIYGENTVIRILSGTKSLRSLPSLGIEQDDAIALKHLFAKPHGMILVVGPTGSGKTTTLYAALREINLIQKNVLTVEDPVEYKLSMVKQESISEKVGYTFALAGKSFMRQDPDVILLGEIRDEDTANIAIRASITGHLLLSTLHTNDAVTVIPRLLDLSVDRFLLSSSLLAVIAQRLVRMVCNNCKIEYEIEKAHLDSLGFSEISDDVKKAFKGEGCFACNDTGYLGRSVIGEILIVNDKIKEMIYSSASINAIASVAVKSGMKTMRVNGIKKAIEGITTFDEIVRVLG